MFFFHAFSLCSFSCPIVSTRDKIPDKQQFQRGHDSGQDKTVNVHNRHLRSVSLGQYYGKEYQNRVHFQEARP